MDDNDEIIVTCAQQAVWRRLEESRMNAHQTNRFARELVENALRERGAGSVHTSENAKKLLVATSMDNTRTVTIQVKAKNKGNWHTSTNEGKPAQTIPTAEDKFWIFVQLGTQPRYWIVPDWWIREILYREHLRYLVENGGHRPVNDRSDHQSVHVTYITQWENRWDVLGIF